MLDPIVMHVVSQERCEECRRQARADHYETKQILQALRRFVQRFTRRAQRQQVAHSARATCRPAASQVRF
jgi:hypothetical protein